MPTFHSSSVKSLSFSYRIKEKGISGWEWGEGRRLNIPLGKWKYPVYVCVCVGGANLQPLSHNKKARQEDFEFAVAWAIY